MLEQYGPLEGKPEFLEPVDYEPVFPGGDPFIQRGREPYGLFGAWLVNVGPDEPVFLHCHELLAIAAYVERHRAWFEHHDQMNEEWWSNEVADGLILVRLRKRVEPAQTTLIALQTKNRFAWYGFPTTEGTSATRVRDFAGQEAREYLSAEWEEDEVPQS